MLKLITTKIINKLIKRAITVFIIISKNGAICRLSDDKTATMALRFIHTFDHTASIKTVITKIKYKDVGGGFLIEKPNT